MREKVFRKLEIKRHFKPALGGLLLGILAFYFPPILGSSYGWVQMALYGKVALWAMILFPFLKILATNFTIGSGGIGGVFAPSLAIGGMVGGAFGAICAPLLPHDRVPGMLVGQNLNDAIDIFNEYGFDEIPVYEKRNEPPVGRLRKKDLLLATSAELGRKAKTSKK